jgi:hypothetical protein
MMPPKMTADIFTPPDVKNLDGNVLSPKITKISNYPGCDKVTCYSITHSNVRDVPANTTLRFAITGTRNQESVQDAGKFLV